MQQSLLTKRFEFKYWLNPIKAKAIEQYIQTHVKPATDDYAAAGGYFVNSLYFDTPHMSDYREKDGSFLIRKKLRARMYEASWHQNLEHVWFEVKHKRNMNIKKTRARITGETWHEFIQENNPITLLAEHVTTDKPNDLAEFAHTHIRQQYRPTAVVRYRRVAYLADFTSPVRITFDYDIQTCRFENSSDKHNLIPVSHGATVLEIKFNNRLPWWFAELLTRFDIGRTDFSKYRNSVAVMRGIQRIPINK